MSDNTAVPRMTSYDLAYNEAIRRRGEAQKRMRLWSKLNMLSIVPWLGVSVANLWMHSDRMTHLGFALCFIVLFTRIVWDEKRMDLDGSFLLEISARDLR